MEGRLGRSRPHGEAVSMEAATDEGTKERGEQLRNLLLIETERQ